MPSEALSCKIAVLNNFAKFTPTHQQQSPIFSKVVGLYSFKGEYLNSVG